MAPSATGPTVIRSNGFTVPLNSQTSSHSKSGPGFRGYHHVTWYVSNAKQAATYYIVHMGFKPIARRGLETGSRYIASHVISNGDAIFVLTSPIRGISSINDESIPASDRALLSEIHSHIAEHGDAVKDVAFEVDDVRAVYNQAVRKGARSIKEPALLRDGKNGEVILATISTYGDTTHTLVERSRYNGIFLPGFAEVPLYDNALTRLLPPVPLQIIDHCVGNQDWDGMESVCE